MWNDIVERLPKYKNAVITGVDPEGYPFSVRCSPQPDSTAQVLRILALDHTEIQAGPASLLCHKHDERFWNLNSFMVWGTLKKEVEGWVFYPKQFTPGAAMDMVSFIRFVRDSRRSARQYLEKRHLSRPAVPWNEIHDLWDQAKSPNNHQPA